MTTLWISPFVLLLRTRSYLEIQRLGSFYPRLSSFLKHAKESLHTPTLMYGSAYFYDS